MHADCQVGHDANLHADLTRHMLGMLELFSGDPLAPLVEVDAISAVHRTEGLVQLALTQAFEGARVVGDHLGPQGGNQEGGAGEQDVTGQDRPVVAPQVLSRGHAATRGRRIHDVVVVQGRQVRELNRRRGSDDLLVERTLGLAQLRAHEGEQRTHPLAASDSEVTRQLVRQVTRG